MPEFVQDFWCSEELLLQVLAFLPPLDLRSCVEVSRWFNRIAVQSVLDTYEIWNAEQSAALELAGNPYDLDGLSALLLSIHLKSLSYVRFDLYKVMSLQSALKSFHKMQRLIDRMASVHTVYVHWPADAYLKRATSEQSRVTACECVEQFLYTAIVAKGCTCLQLSGFNAFTSEYRLKKNPAITLADGSKALVAEGSSIWESVRGYLTSRRARPNYEPSVSSEEVYYCRKQSRFSISTPRIYLTSSPNFGQASKLTTLIAFSTNIFRPPFSQWTFSLLKASPIASLTLYFTDLPNEDVESKLILDRLAEAVPDVTTIHLEDARSGLMKDVVPWLGRFELLEALIIEPECFCAETNIDDLELQALARLPDIRTLTSSSSFLCAYLASRNSVSPGTLPSDMQDIIMRHMWTSSTRSAISAFVKDVELLHNAIVEASPEPEGRNFTLRINIRFNCFSDRVEALTRIWDQFDSGILHLACDEEKPSVEGPPCFRPSESQPWLCLELHLPATRDKIQRGALDREIMAFSRMFPTVTEILLSSPQTSVQRPRQSLKRERLDKLKTVCPELCIGWVY
ncbi:hypothetical protein H1R20_g13273, partial [Candolleomyces eurysporus]